VSTEENTRATHLILVEVRVDVRVVLSDLAVALYQRRLVRQETQHVVTQVGELLRRPATHSVETRRLTPGLPL